MSEEVVVRNEPEPDQEYEQEMARKGEQLEQNNDPNRPDWLPEKFNSPEEMARSYAELEKKLGEQNQGGDQSTGESNDKDKGSQDNAAKDQGTDLEISDEDQEKLDNQNISMSDLVNEYNKNGELSDETYQRLEKAGFSREDVDTYIEGRKAQVDKIRQDAMSVVGGEENYKAMAEWAKANLSSEEREAFNESIRSTNAATREMAIRGLYSKYVDANGSEPKTTHGQGAAGPGEVYESNAQVMQDIQDPRYKTDPAFRQKVADKLARSKNVLI